MDLSANHILVVFLLTTLAGLATGIGGFIAFFMKRTDTKTLTFSLGFSCLLYTSPSPRDRG